MSKNRIIKFSVIVLAIILVVILLHLLGGNFVSMLKNHFS